MSQSVRKTRSAPRRSSRKSWTSATLTGAYSSRGAPPPARRARGVTDRLRPDRLRRSTHGSEELHGHGGRGRGRPAPGPRARPGPAHGAIRRGDRQGRVLMGPDRAREGDVQLGRDRRAGPRRRGQRAGRHPDRRRLADLGPPAQAPARPRGGHRAQAPAGICAVHDHARGALRAARGVLAGEPGSPRQAHPGLGDLERAGDPALLARALAAPVHAVAAPVLSGGQEVRPRRPRDPRGPDLPLVEVPEHALPGGSEALLRRGLAASVHPQAVERRADDEAGPAGAGRPPRPARPHLGDRAVVDVRARARPGRDGAAELPERHAARPGPAPARGLSRAGQGPAALRRHPGLLVHVDDAGQGPRGPVRLLRAAADPRQAHPLQAGAPRIRARGAPARRQVRLRARGAVVAACLATAASALAPAAPASARRSVPRGWVGMVAGIELSQRPALVPGQMAMMARAGAESVRAEFSWATIEPDPGVYRWHRPDTLVAAAARRRLALVPTVLRAPGWAAASRDEPTFRPRDPRQYAAFMTALVQRYGPHGSFWAEHPKLPRRPVRSWQVWNEPDQQYFWHPPWVKGYVALLRAADQAIHRADPGARTVLAGLTYRTWDDLRSLYRHGAGGAFDVAALHPYTHSRKGVATTVRQAQEGA